jgi:hypothetical protein
MPRTSLRFTLDAQRSRRQSAYAMVAADRPSRPPRLEPAHIDVARWKRYVSIWLMNQRLGLVDCDAIGPHGRAMMKAR